MVVDALRDAIPKKRRKLESPTARPAPARYPPSFVRAALLFRQAPQCLTTSCHSVAVTVPPKPNPPGVHAITGEHYTLDLPTKEGTLNKTPIRLAEQYHDQNIITHLQWNQRGTTLASADETGKVALWSLGVSLKCIERDLLG